MRLHLRNRNWTHLLRNQTGQAFVDRHPQAANTLAPQSHSRRQYQIGAIRLQQVRRAHIRPEPLGNQGDHIHQRFRWLASFRCEVPNFFER
jgi:hypothetical protein